MDVYGRTGYAKVLGPQQVEVRKAKEAAGQIVDGAALTAPYDDPLHYMAAVLNGEIQEGDSLSSLKTNVIASEILDAARQSAQTGKAIQLPLEK
jgi:predicted RNA binding protein with dsRBD fold (UPF0201 family)